MPSRSSTSSSRTKAGSATSIRASRTRPARCRPPRPERAPHNESETMVPPVAALQPFGHIQDLELEFASADRPRLVTALLAGRGESPEFWWGQTVGARIAALLRVVALTEGERGVLVIGLRCGDDACGETFEIALPYDALFDAGSDGAAAAPERVPLAGGRTAVLRRPTGADLRDWRDGARESRPQAVAAMLDALVIEGEVEPDDMPVIAEAMAEHDPLVA